jgi:hypothetical protein
LSRPIHALADRCAQLLPWVLRICSELDNTICGTWLASTKPAAVSVGNPPRCAEFCPLFLHNLGAFAAPVRTQARRAPVAQQLP